MILNQDMRIGGCRNLILACPVTRRELMWLTKLFPPTPSKTLKTYKEIYATLSIIALICFIITAIDRFFKKEAILIMSWHDAEIALLLSFIFHVIVSLLYYYFETVSKKDSHKDRKKRIILPIFRGIAFLSVLWYAWCVTSGML